MNRRSFLTAILALAAAPAVVKASNIMRVWPVFTGGEYGWQPFDGSISDALFTGEIGRYEGVSFRTNALGEGTVLTEENTGILTISAVNQIIDVMKIRHIPPDRNGNYVFLAHPKAIEQYRAAGLASRRR